MRCANKAATDASARMRAAGEKASQDSAAGDRSPAAADKQPKTPKVAGARSHPSADSSSAASAAGGSTMGDDPEIDILFSGESDSPSDLKSSAKLSLEAVSAEMTTAQRSGSLIPNCVVK